MALFSATIVSRSFPKISDFVSSTTQKFNHQNLLFSISSNIPPSELSHLVDQFESYAGETAGCIAAAPPLRDDSVSCSIAVFDRTASVLFRSTLPGREAPQVGRWHSYRKMDQAVESAEPSLGPGFDWTDVWERNRPTELPSELQALEPKDVSSVVHFTDPAHEGLSLALNAFPAAAKVGLIAAPTPFITGRSVTLFRNQNIHGSGAVGLALLRTPAVSRFSFPGLQPMSPTMIVTQSEGNLVMSIDSMNPTQLLLSQIRSLNKDLLSIFDEEYHLAVLDDGDRLVEMHTISAGDPSRGTLSLKTVTAPPARTRVQFYRRAEPSGWPTIIPKATSKLRMSFTTLGQQFIHTDAGKPDFWACSESGMVLNRGGRTWACTVPGATVYLDFGKDLSSSS